MKTLFINGSPKKSFSASGHFLKLLSVPVRGIITREQVRGKGDHARVLEKLKDMDAVVFSLPLYVDGIPSHILSFLKEMERYCLEQGIHCTVYVISNSGYIEGIQNKTLMAQFRNFCVRAGLTWGGGVGIGGGVMLNVLSIIFWVVIGLTIANSIISLVETGQIISMMVVENFLTNMGIILFFHLGVFYCGLRLARAINRGQCCGEKYTRVLVPSLVFILYADLYFLIVGLFKGKLPWQLVKGA